MMVNRDATASQEITQSVMGPHELHPFTVRLPGHNRRVWGFMFMALRDAVSGQGEKDPGHAMFLAVLSAAITLVFAVIFLVSL